MTYSKPEVVVLGEAAGLILGGGSRTIQQNELPQNDSVKAPADCEFDD
jgi:hypothetical protein